MCLVNQKHLRWIWLKQPQNNSKIGLTHAASETHSRTRAHTLEGYTAPLSVWVYLRAVFLAGHSCGNEYQMWFCSHKSKPSAVFWLSFPRLKSIRRGSVHYTYTPRLNSFLWNSHRGVFRSRRLRRGRGDIKACFECTADECTSCIMYANRKPRRHSILKVWEMKGMMITEGVTYSGNDSMLFAQYESCESLRCFLFGVRKHFSPPRMVSHSFSNAGVGLSYNILSNESYNWTWLHG